MKKSLIITIAAAILLLALGSWLYLFLFGTPQTSDEFFTDLGFELGNQAVVPIESDVVNEPTLSLLDTENERLTQLTNRPIAGFIALNETTIRFAERGTGHIYDIDTAADTETRRTNTTIPQVVEAVFSTDGTQVVLTSESGYSRTSVYGSIPSNTTDATLQTSSLPPQADELAFVGTSTLGYILSTENGTVGYRLNVVANTQQADFEVPFRSIRAIFNPTQTLLYNRHAPSLAGGLFEVSGRSISQIGSTEFGLTALTGQDWYSVTLNQNNEIVSRTINIESDVVYESPIVIIPEKCTWTTDNSLWCGAPAAAVPYTYQKDWYQGEIRANDMIWQIDPATESALLVINPQTEVGRQLDIINPQLQDQKVFFTNRLDNTLWQYDGTIR